MPSSSLGGTVIEIRVPRRMWDPESEWEGWGTVVRVSRHKETSLMGTGPAATAQKRLTDMSVIRYVPFFFFSFSFFLLDVVVGPISVSLYFWVDSTNETLSSHTPLLLFYTFSHIHLCPFHPLLYLLNLSSSF